MAHAHSRTALASFGFDDPDKKNSRHDSAIMYLSQPDMLKRISMLAFPDCRRNVVNANYNGVETQTFIKVVSHSTEQVVSKGQNQYKQLQGFLDLSLVVELEERFKGLKLTREGYGYSARSTFKDHEESSRGRRTLNIEVKIGRESVGNMIRQIKFYKANMDPAEAWMLVTAWPLTQAEIGQLDNEKIKLSVLGPGFEEFERALEFQPAAEGTPLL